MSFLFLFMPWAGGLALVAASTYAEEKRVRQLLAVVAILLLSPQCFYLFGTGAVLRTERLTAALDECYAQLSPPPPPTCTEQCAAAGMISGETRDGTCWCATPNDLE